MGRSTRVQIKHPGVDGDFRGSVWRECAGSRDRRRLHIADRSELAQIRLLALYGLVNNAGVGSAGPLVDMPLEEFDLTMAVNVYGPYRVTKAFAPLIIASQGRITTIGSIAGTLSRRNAAAYSMSKHAVEAFTDSLVQEMEPLGVTVNIVEPGNYDSDIARNAVARAGLDPKLGDRSQFKPPDEVAAAVALALFEAKPKRRYLVVPNAEEAEITILKQIQELVQLNEGHAYTYDRDALVRMLDQELARSRPRTK